MKLNSGMSLLKKSWVLFSLLIFISAFSKAKAESVVASDGGKPWERRDVTKVRAAKSPDELNQYGGFKGEKVEEPGYFRVIKKSKDWWLVDPEGCLFLSIGVNSVEPERVGRSDVEAWTNETADLLKGARFNTIGRWSDPRAFKQAGRRIPWCNTLGFMTQYSKQRSSEFGEAGLYEDTIPVFDGAWPKFCEEYAMEKAKPHTEDPWLLGHFSDNELPFRPDALQKYLDLPEDDAGHQGALKWMEENRVRKGKVDDPKVQAKFLEFVARRYFEVVAAALEKADPNHLYIGSRLHGRCINESVLRASEVCDVVSINYYHRWEGEKDRTRDWTKWSERPFLVGEFYAMKVSSKRTKADGAGFRVLSYEDAGAFYHTYVNSLLENIPNCVGWHWFKYANDNADYEKGIVGQKGEVHAPLIKAMKEVNEQAYSLRGLQ